MRRTGLALVFATSAMLSGCVSPADRVPVNRGLQTPSLSLFGHRRAASATHYAVREPGSFFGLPTPATATASTVPARPLPTVAGDRVDRPSLLGRREGMPRFFPGLFGQGQGDAERLARAKSPVRQDFRQDGGVATVGHDAPMVERTGQTTPEAAVQETDSAVKETAAEVEKADADADVPLLPVGLKVEAYPVKPSATLPGPSPVETTAPTESKVEAPVPALEPSTQPVPSEPKIVAPTPASEPSTPPSPAEDQSGLRVEAPREDPAQPPAEERRAAEPKKDSGLLPIPGLDDRVAPPPPTSDADTEAAPAAAPTPEPAPAPNPAYHPGAAAAREPERSAPAAASGGRFRVTPKAGVSAPPENDEPRRGPISRLIRRLRGVDTASNR